MEENRDMAPETEPEAYKPRPAWQVWLARVGLVVVVICVILYYLHIFRGGLL